MNGKDTGGKKQKATTPEIWDPKTVAAMPAAADDANGGAEAAPAAAILDSSPDTLSSSRWAVLGRGEDMRSHGSAAQRGLNCPRSYHYDQGRFGRLFPLLPPLSATAAQMRELGKKGGLMDAQDPPPPAPNPISPDNADIPSGFTFLGQFLDHDMTFDPTSSLERQMDPEAVRNFRTPLLELDSVYGAGPGASPWLYQRANPNKLLVAATLPANAQDTGEQPLLDLPRNEEGRALLGDPRNDENRIVSQFHVAFLRFHNAVVDKLGATTPGVFEVAQKAVRWHYQWVVVHDFLPRTCGKALVDDILANGRKFYHWRHAPYIPVEFAVSAYRFGHSQVRPGYGLSQTFAGAIFPNLAGGQRIKKSETVDWGRFFQGVRRDDGATTGPTPSKAIDPKLSTPLFELPGFSGGPEDPQSLAERNLRRHLTFGLPSGQRVARAMGEAPLTPAELSELAPLGLDRNTPLWYYVLAEAKARAGGKTLGPVGGRIVAEVFLGVLEGDPFSYLREDPTWEPDLFTDSGFTAGQFTMADLLIAAGVATRAA